MYANCLQGIALQICKAAFYAGTCFLPSSPATLPLLNACCRQGPPPVPTQASPLLHPGNSTSDLWAPLGCTLHLSAGVLPSWFWGDRPPGRIQKPSSIRQEAREGYGQVQGRPGVLEGWGRAPGRTARRASLAPAPVTVSRLHSEGIHPATRSREAHPHTCRHVCAVNGKVKLAVACH